MITLLNILKIVASLFLTLAGLKGTKSDEQLERRLAMAEQEAQDAREALTVALGDTLERDAIISRMKDGKL